MADPTARDEPGAGSSGSSGDHRRPYDCIVLGTGAAGSAALYHLARRGARVLGLDRFEPGHDRGSSHGETRIIRQAYFEHPDYVPLLLRAYDRWRDLEETSGKTLHRETGLVEIGPPGGEVVPGVLASAASHRLEVERLEAREIERRFPGFRVPEGLTGVYEPRAGFLLVEECVRTHVAEAVRLGADLRTGETILSWRRRPEGITVATTRRRYLTARLVIAPGAWAGDLLGDIGVPFAVRRKPLFWFRCASPVYRIENGTPCFLYELPRGREGGGAGAAESDVFYGFPDLPPRGLKVAEHTGGDEAADPLAVDRELHRRDAAAVERFLRRCLPAVTTERLRHEVCLYTLTPDAHFVVDRHPSDEDVVFAAGLSGHGFKFSAILGAILAEMVLEGTSPPEIAFLGRKRFA